MSLKVICLLESVMSVSFSWLNHDMAFKQKAVATVQSRKVCSIESGGRQTEHTSFSTSLNLKRSFLVIIILCSILNENCLNLLSFVDLYINVNFFPPIFEIIREIVFPVFNASRLDDTVSIENFIVAFAAHFS